MLNANNGVVNSILRAINVGPVRFDGRRAGGSRGLLGGPRFDGDPVPCSDGDANAHALAHTIPYAGGCGKADRGLLYLVEYLPA